MPHFFSRSCLTIFIYQLDLLFKNVVRLPQTLKKKTENVVLFPFGKGNSKALTDYQTAVNEAAGKLATANPQLLCNRGASLFRLSHCSVEDIQKISS